MQNSNVPDDGKIPYDTEGEQQQTVHEPAEERSVTKAGRLSARLIYEVIRRDGEEELSRPTVSLIWSGLAAGILICFSVVAQAILHTNLPRTEWSVLIESFGYSFGFLVVIFGRMQLFTENTITTVLPVVARRQRSIVLHMLRLWGIVCAANLLGTLIAAGFLTLPEVVDPKVMESMILLSGHAVDGTFRLNLLLAIPAGVVIAAIVWLMPTAQGNSFFIILSLTWLMSAAGFKHVVAGSVEMWLLVLEKNIALGSAMASFLLPVFIGNVIGGTVIFTLVTWGQVKNEVRQGDKV